MHIDFEGELTKILSSSEVRARLAEVVREAVRTEFATVLRDELVDVSEAAAILKMSEAAVRKAAERGQLRTIKVGRRVRFRRTDLLQP